MGKAVEVVSDLFKKLPKWLRAPMAVLVILLVLGAGFEIQTPEGSYGFRCTHADLGEEAKGALAEVGVPEMPDLPEMPVRYVTEQVRRHHKPVPLPPPPEPAHLPGLPKPHPLDYDPGRHSAMLGVIDDEPWVATGIRPPVDSFLELPLSDLDEVQVAEIDLDRLRGICEP